MPRRLTDDQVAQYREQGFTAPVSVLTDTEVKRYRSEMEDFERSIGKPLTFPEKSKPHLIFGWADAIAHHPAVLDAVEDIIGPDILLFHFTVQTKEAHTPTFAHWHQDDAYFYLDPAEQITAWVPLSEASVQAGCMRMIPGSHKSGLRGHVDQPSADNIIRRGARVMEYGDHDGVAVPVHAGEMSLHHTHTVHSSGANDSDDRRIGLTLSYIPTRVRPTGSLRPTALLVRGVDKYNHFVPEKKLLGELSAEARAEHARAIDIYQRNAKIAA